MQQHSNLPAHVHFIVAAKGYRPLITHLYPRPDDPFLQDDSGFGHKPELVKQPQPNIDGTILNINHDFILIKSDQFQNLDPLNYVPAASAGLFFSSEFQREFQHHHQVK
jgi:hypothetical protein